MAKLFLSLCRPAGPAAVFENAFLACFGIAVALTNEIHAWAHAANTPTWIRRLQRLGLVLRPAPHARHHLHGGTYCITGGRLGLRRSTGTRWGMLRLRTVGRHSGAERSVILGYLEDGDNLVTMAMNGWADQDDLRLRFDVLTKTKQPELHRYWTQRDRAANVRLFHLVAEILHAIAAGVFVPNPGWQCKDCPFQSRCWAWK